MIEDANPLPEFDESIQCPWCSPRDKPTIFTLYGLFGGGGPGRYTMCSNCGTVLSKTCDTHEEPANGATEIKTADVQSPGDDEPRGSAG